MNDSDLISNLIIKPSNVEDYDCILKTIESYLIKSKEESKEKIDYMSNLIITEIIKVVEDESLNFIRVKIILDVTSIEADDILYKLECIVNELNFKVDFILDSPFNLIYDSLYNYIDHNKCSLNPLEIIKIPIKLNSKTRNSIITNLLKEIGTSIRLKLPYNTIDDLLEYCEIIESKIITKSDASIGLVVFSHNLYTEIDASTILKKLNKYSKIIELYD